MIADFCNFAVKVMYTFSKFCLVLLIIFLHFESMLYFFHQELFVLDSSLKYCCFFAFTYISQKQQKFANKTDTILNKIRQ